MQVALNFFPIFPIFSNFFSHFNTCIQKEIVVRKAADAADGIQRDPARVSFHLGAATA